MKVDWKISHDLTASQASTFLFFLLFLLLNYFPFRFHFADVLGFLFGVSRFVESAVICPVSFSILINGTIFVVLNLKGQRLLFRVFVGLSWSRWVSHPFVWHFRLFSFGLKIISIENFVLLVNGFDLFFYDIVLVFDFLLLIFQSLNFGLK